MHLYSLDNPNKELREQEEDMSGALRCVEGACVLLSFLEDAALLNYVIAKAASTGLSYATSACS